MPWLETRNHSPFFELSLPTTLIRQFSGCSGTSHVAVCVCQLIKRFGSLTHTEKCVDRRRTWSLHHHGQNYLITTTLPVTLERLNLTAGSTWEHLCTAQVGDWRHDQQAAVKSAINPVTAGTRGCLITDWTQLHLWGTNGSCTHSQVATPQHPAPTAAACPLSVHTF